ncbi:TPR-like protein [Mytilinidion resinicola]|uniref:TPR-like protein n=1 Tax=Mytilinidion resinicola TaxID=574789 RepID=A0A6A6Z8D7_9PEZI|nr:TPR-like protein [Mytilinidion resinicola]KAF2817382.1 TPR-like protein [Mytilinidion resinicola]
MADAYLSFLRITLPDDLVSVLSDILNHLEKGEYDAVLQSPQVAILLGLQDNEKTQDVSASDFPLWSDYVSRRLGLILANCDEETQDSAAYLQHLFLVVAVACLYAFLQSNVTGPPLPFSSSKTLFPQEISSNPSAVSTLRQDLIQSLSADGEAAYKLTPNIELLCLADTILSSPPIQKNIKAAAWVKLRTTFLHQRLLSEIAPSLQSSIYENLEALEADLLSTESQYSTPDIRVQFLLERATIHTHHGLDKKARSDLNQAASQRHFEFALTGLLGKRTKFQQFDTSQLVVLARSAKDTNEAPRVDGQETGAKIDSSRPKTLDLNDDTLLESISFVDTPFSSTDVKDESKLPASLTTLDPANQPLLEPLDSIILLSLASSITNTSPSDGLTREETIPYATRVLDGGSSNWQVYTQALLVRSRIEGYRSRTIERGLLQLQALVDQVIADTTSDSPTPTGTTTFLPKANETDSAPVSERIKYIFQLCSPSRWELEAELASRWVSMGGLRSALEIYERLEMWAEAALCWAATEREDKAKKIIRRQLFHATNGPDDTADPEEEKWEGPLREPAPADAPRLYCILGDIDQDTAMYETAWTVSKNRYARAQRSLGRHYFTLKDYERAITAYSASLKMNALNQSSWFALGCAHLELSQFKNAVEAFSRCVQLDDTDAEAWSNLAAALLHLRTSASQEDEDGEAAHPLAAHQTNPQQPRLDALKAFRRAAALKHDSYRIWSNLLTVAASTVPPAYNDIVRAQTRICELRGVTDGEACVDAAILAALVRHIASVATEPYDPAKPGLARMVGELVDKHVVPLITASAKLWQVVARLALFRRQPSAALAAHEKAWRAVAGQPGWETGSVEQWEGVVDATVELADAYESLGEMERTEGLAAGSGEVVAKDWRFKARSAVRGIMGRGKESWEGTEGWERLVMALEGLKGGR